MRLRERREAAGLSLGQVAEYEGKHKSQISKLETGYSDPPSWPLLAALARRYRTSTDYLLGLSDDPSPATVRELPPHGAEVLEIMRELGPMQQMQLLRHAQVLQEDFAREVLWFSLRDQLIERLGIAQVRELNDELSTSLAELGLDKFENRLMALRRQILEEYGDDVD